MKEELLIKLKKETIDKYNKIQRENITNKKIRELLAKPSTKEYYSMMGEKPIIDEKTLVDNNETIEEIFLKKFNNHIYDIEKRDTNKLFIKRGSYIREYIDSVLGEQDTLVPDSDPCIDFVSYHDLEQLFSINIPLKEKKQFEENNYILNTSYDDYYKIRREFIIDMYHNGQRRAKDNIIKKYVKKK